MGSPSSSRATGYAGHLVRDLSNTHVMIVGGGTLIATGPLLATRSRASSGGRSRATASRSAPSGSRSPGCAVFYVSLIGNGIAMGRLMEHGWSYQAAKEHMGNWYQRADGRGRGGDGPRLLVLRDQRRR